MTLGTETPTYADLFLATLPRPIKSEEEADAIQHQIDALIDKQRELTADERDFLALLASLVLMWERDKYEPPQVAPHELVKAMIEDSGLRQKDLVGPVFPTESIASEVLSGKRKLTYDFVERLADYFHVSPAVFYASPDQ